MTRRTLSLSIICLMAALLGVASVHAEDDMQAVGALWTDFTSALRRGDYNRAHRLFSPESKTVLSYQNFVSEYGPLSAAREMVLAKPESLSTRVDGDWAEVTFAGVNPGTGRRFQVGAAMVKNQGGWGLVAARNEARERIEALARGILRDAGTIRKFDNAPARLAGMLASLPPENPIPKMYRFEIDVNLVRAIPLVGGLRPFYLDDWGMAQPGMSPSVPPPSPAKLDDAIRDRSAPPPEEPRIPALSGPIPEPGVKLPPARVAPPPAAPKTVNGLPELSEPPFPGAPGTPGMTSMPAEPAEPGLPPLSPPPPPPTREPTPPRPPVAKPEPERITLPDSIN